MIGSFVWREIVVADEDGIFGENGGGERHCWC